MIAPTELSGGSPVDDVAILLHRQHMASLSTVEKLKLIRQRLGLTAEEAAAAWKLNLSTLRAYEGKSRATPTKPTANAARIARIVREQEAYGGVLHYLWRPTNRQSVTKKQIQTNDSTRSRPRRRTLKPRRSVPR